MAWGQTPAGSRWHYFTEAERSTCGKAIRRGATLLARDVAPHVHTRCLTCRRILALRRAASGKPAPYVQTPAVSEEQAWRVIEKLRAGKATIMGEARLLRVYHANLRKAVRRAMGAKAYEDMMMSIRTH